MFLLAVIQILVQYQIYALHRLVHKVQANQCIAHYLRL